MLRPHSYWVFLAATPAGDLCVGMTPDLERPPSRTAHASDTATCSPERLVYAEPYPTAGEAAQRERQLRALPATDRIALVHADNPTWRLAA